MIAYDYPLLGMFWTLMWWFLWVAWILLVFQLIVDIFRSDDIGDAKKAFWAMFVVLLPWLGVLLYLIVRGGSMAQRDLDQAAAHEAAFQSYIKRTVAPGSTADELTKLATLHQKGVVTDAELTQQKARLLS
jgi:hypothetical protein